MKRFADKQTLHKKYGHSVPFKVDGKTVVQMGDVANCYICLLPWDNSKEIANSQAFEDWLNDYARMAALVLEKGLYERHA